MSVLKTFCCCGPLKCGTIFAGVAGIILAIVVIILIFTVSVDLRTIILDDILPKGVVLWILVINFIMTIVISIALIYGTVKRNMYCMLPWVILGALLPIAILISAIMTAIVSFNDEKTDQTINGIVWLVLGIIAAIVVVYFWLVVFSYFQIVKEEHGERSKYQQAPYRRHY